MSAIVISGYYGFTNAGDEAMLTAMIEALNAVEPGVSITVISGNPQDTQARHGVKAVYRLHYPGIIKSLTKADIFISGGGSLLQDVTSDRSLYYYLSVMMLAQKMGVPVALYGQGIGPVRGALAKGALRYIGNMADLITVRDQGSADELARLGVTRPPVYVTADPVLAMYPVGRGIGRQILLGYDDKACEGPLIGFSVREWKDWEGYKCELARAADLLAAKYKARIVFLPMQYPEDLTVSRQIAARMTSRAVVPDQKFSTFDLLSLVGNMDFLIGIRLHALIFAAIMSVPAVGISYDPKVDRFLDSLGEKPAGTLGNITHEALLGKVEAVMADAGYQERMRQRMQILRSNAFYNAKLALGLVKGN